MKYLNKEKLSEIHDLIKSVHYGEKEARLIVIGDSLKSISYATDTHNYYKMMFAQLGIDVVFSAENALTSHQWMTNTSSTGQAKIDYVETQLIGDGGENTIIEYCLFKNDHATLGGAIGTKEQMRKALQSLIKIAPKAKIILSIPGVSGTVDTGIDAQGIFRQLGEEMDLFVVDGFEATIDCYPRNGAVNCMMSDMTHVNNYGMARIVNNLIDEITPPELKWLVRVVEFPNTENEPTPVNLAVVETGMYNDLGADLTGSNWRRLDAIVVAPRTIYKLKHQGTRRDIYYKFGTTNTWFKVNLPNLLPNQDHWLIYVPEYATQLKVNIETVSGGAYDALNDVPELSNAFHQTGYVMPQSKINIGLEIEIKQ